MLKRNRLIDSTNPYSLEELQGITEMIEETLESILQDALSAAKEAKLWLEFDRTQDAFNQDAIADEIRELHRAFKRRHAAAEQKKV